MIARSLVGRVLVIWSHDPALDRAHPSFAEAWAAFIAAGTRETLAAVPMKDGQKPTVFEVAGLSRSTFLLIEQNARGALADNEAVGFGLRAIAGDFAPYMCHGEPVVITPSDLKEVPGTRDKRVADDILDKLFDPALFSELAARILEISRPDPMRG